MNFRLYVRFIVFIVILVLFQACKKEKASPPNLIIVLVDDMGYSDPGCYGGEISTPNLDQLASNGLRFTQFYNTGRCWPTRSSLMTGYYAQAVGMDPPGPPSPPWALSIPQYLRPLGYRSYHSGKWHIGNKPDSQADAGFDRSYYCIGYDNHFSWRHMLDGEELPLFNPDSGYYSTTVFTDYALDFLQEHQETHNAAPFFLYLAYIVPHFPVQAPLEDIEKYLGIYREGWDRIRQTRYERMVAEGLINTTLSAREPEVNVTYEHLMADSVLLDSLGDGEVLFPVSWESLTPEQKEFQATKMAIHAAMVDRVDQEMGRMIDYLESIDELDNTVIMFLSDNGASAEIMIRGGGHDPEAVPGTYQSYLCLGPGFGSASNSPFRRYKHWTHEGGVATPLIVHWPKGIGERGVLRHHTGHVVDLLPTLLDLAGGTFQPVRDSLEIPALHGESLVPVFHQDHSISKEHLFFSHDGNRALRKADWKVVSPKSDEDWSLYDMSTDRAEENDLSSANPEIKEQMIREWHELNEKYRKMGGYQ